MEEKTPKKKNKLWLKLLIVFIVAVISLILYSRYIATSGLIVKEYLIVDENLPDNFYGLKVAHISDLHYGQTVHKKDLNNVVKRTNEYKPDIIVISGDLLDRDIEYTDQDFKDIENALNKLSARFGTYIIMGNHDNTQENYKTLIEATGIIDLDDKHHVLYSGDNIPILIAGMSTGENWIYTPGQKVEGAINVSTELEVPFNILVMHEPDYIEDFEYENFQLILAGHSHNGQVRLPLIAPLILPSHSRKYYGNHYDLGATQLFISSGVGTSNMKFRLFNRPSINIYRIINK